MYTSLRDGVLTRYAPGGAERLQLTSEEIPAAPADVFGAAPALYLEAAGVQARYVPRVG